MLCQCHYDLVRERNFVNGTLATQLPQTKILMASHELRLVKRRAWSLVDETYASLFSHFSCV
jgi:hypothetical protein